MKSGNCRLFDIIKEEERVERTKINIMNVWPVIYQTFHFSTRSNNCAQLLRSISSNAMQDEDVKCAYNMHIM